jgi:endonuclease YncB( thermonuclease family)
MKTRSMSIAALALVTLTACGGAVAASTPAPTVSSLRPSVPTTAGPQTTEATTPATTATTSPMVAVSTVVVTQVIDGDTIVIDTGEHVRLIGIDTPEAGHCGSDTATRNLRNLVYAKAVVLTAGARDDVDKYGRLLRYVELPDGTDAGLAQIHAGLAIARYDSRDGYGYHDREDQYVAADTGADVQCIASAPSSSNATASSSTPSGESVYYANCDAARAAGAAPLHRGEPGYRAALDGDHDGVACA